MCVRRPLPFVAFQDVVLDDSGRPLGQMLWKEGGVFIMEAGDFRVGAHFDASSEYWLTPADVLHCRPTIPPIRVLQGWARHSDNPDFAIFYFCQALWIDSTLQSVVWLARDERQPCLRQPVFDYIRCMAVAGITGCISSMGENFLKQVRSDVCRDDQRLTHSPNASELFQAHTISRQPVGCIFN